LKAIIDQLATYIETWAQDQVSTLSVLNYGFCELVNRESKGTTKNLRNQASISTQPIPITIPGDGTEGEQVALNDQYDFIFWIRVTGRASFVQNDDDRWGLKDGRRQNLPLRIVIAHRNNLGEDLVYNLVHDLPENFYIQAFEFVFINNNGDVDNDHETIHNTELGLTNYEKHRFTWNIYTINLNVEFIPCTDFVPREFITDQFGNCLFA
jgi:hypothetical protein